MDTIVLYVACPVQLKLCGGRRLMAIRGLCFVSFEPTRGMRQPALLFEPGSETSRETWCRVTPVAFDPPRNKVCGHCAEDYLSGLLLMNN